MFNLKLYKSIFLKFIFSSTVLLLSAKFGNGFEKRKKSIFYAFLFDV